MSITFRVQYLATLCVNFLSISYGIAVGWSSPTMPILRSDATPLASGPLTLAEQSMVMAILCIGGAVGSILFGWMADKLGRKTTLILLAAPMSVSWLMIAYAQNATHLTVSRFFAGFTGGGMFVVVPVYVSEIAHDSVRGILGSALVMLSNFGTLIGFIIGAFLDYFIVPFIALGFIACFLIGMTVMPETPPYLFAKLRMEDGEQALRFLRGVNVKDKFAEFEKELQQMRERSLSSRNASEVENEQRFAWGDFFVPATLRGLVIGLVLVVMTQLTGIYSITNYTSTIFKDAGSSLEPNISTIIVGIVQLIGANISVTLADRAGRKILIAGSAFGAGFCLTIMGAFLFIKEGGVDVTSYSWIPIVSLSGAVFITSTGIPLAYVVMSETVPQNLKSTVTSGLCFMCWMTGYILVQYFSAMIDMMGLHGCMWFFAGCCFFEVLFVVIFMPETKGKSFEEIKQLLS